MGQVSPQQAADYFFQSWMIVLLVLGAREEKRLLSLDYILVTHTWRTPFYWRRGATCVHSIWRVAYHTTYSAFLLVLLKQESHFTARSLHFLIFIFLDDIALDCLFNCLKEINIFGKIKKFQFSFGFVFILSTLCPPLPSPPLNFLFVLVYQF